MIRFWNTPQGYGHLKYFEKNPHPDRISDEEVQWFDFFNKDDLNESPLVKEIEFETLKRKLDPVLSNNDRMILRIVDALKDKIGEDQGEDTRKSYTHVLDCFYSYFTTPLDETVSAPIQWIDFLDATDHYYVKDIIKDLGSNLFNDNATKKLIEKLKLAGAFADSRKDFYFWNTDPRNWLEISYQARSVLWEKVMHTFSENGIPPQYIALGNFTINAIPEGYVEPKGNGRYTIWVTKIYYFANDVFNFEGCEYLGRWNLADRNAESYNIRTHLFNRAFRNFRRHGYGRYFPVLSPLHELEGFKPIPIEYINEK